MVFALKVRRDRAPVKSTCATLAARAVLMAMVACGGACVGFGVVCFCVCVEIHALGRDASQTGGARARLRPHTRIIHARIVEAPATPREPMANVAMDARARGLARAFRDEVSTMRACVTRREVWDEYDNKIFTITHLSR